MIQPTKIHFAILNCTSTTQSSPHFEAMAFVHCRSSVLFAVRRYERTWSVEIMVIAVKMSRPYTANPLRRKTYLRIYLQA